MRFHARFLYHNRDEFLATAGLADDEFETHNHVLFERNLCPSEQDLRLGHDKPHVEVRDQISSGYGCVKQVHLQVRQLTVDFEPDLPGVGASLIVEIETEAGLSESVETLRLIFGDRFTTS